MTTHLQVKHLRVKGKDSPSVTLITWEVIVAASCYLLPCIIVPKSAADRSLVVLAIMISSARIQCRCSFEKKRIGCSKDCTVACNQAGQPRGRIDADCKPCTHKGAYIWLE